MYVQRNIDVRSCNHCCSGKAISITYSECAFLALGTQKAMRMCHTVIYGLPRSSIFFQHYLKNRTILYFLYNFCIKHFLFWEEMSEIWSKMCIGLHVKCPLFLFGFNETWILSTDFSKATKISHFKTVRQREPCYSMWTDGLTMTKLIVVFAILQMRLKKVSFDAVFC